MFKKAHGPFVQRRRHGVFVVKCRFKPSSVRSDIFGAFEPKSCRACGELTLLSLALQIFRASGAQAGTPRQLLFPFDTFPQLANFASPSARLEDFPLD
jgi:hypothetical protein